jgi:hypothetical protein
MQDVPELERFEREREALRQDAEKRFADLTPPQLDWRPAPGVWSIGQVVEHLVTTNALYASKMEEAIREARARGRLGQEPYRPSLVGGWLVRTMTSPRRYPAPGVFRPSSGSGRDWKAEIERYRGLLDQLGRLLQETRGVSLNRAKVVSPVTRLMRMNLGDAFSLWLAHDRRHLGQMQRVREHPDFPN